MCYILTIQMNNYDHVSTFSVTVSVEVYYLNLGRLKNMPGLKQNILRL